MLQILVRVRLRGRCCFRCASKRESSRKDRWWRPILLIPYVQYPSSFKVNGFIQFVAKHFSKTYLYKQSLINIQSCFNLPIHQVLFTKCPLKKNNKQHFGRSLIRATSATLATGGASLISSVLGFSRGTTARGTTARGAGAAALGKRPVEATAGAAASRRLARKGTSGASGFSRESCFILDYRWIGSFKPHKNCKKKISSKQKRKPDTFFGVLDIPRQK